MYDGITQGTSTLKYTPRDFKIGSYDADTAIGVSNDGTQSFDTLKENVEWLKSKTYEAAGVKIDTASGNDWSTISVCDDISTKSSLNIDLNDFSFNGKSATEVLEEMVANEIAQQLNKEIVEQILNIGTHSEWEMMI